MAKNLVIVESPAKAKTIQGYLGPDYKVVSSYGHVRDLPKKKLGVDVENGFKPEYEVPADKQKTVNALKKDLKPGTHVWLATDEDREGEAIAWHLKETLKLKADQLKRITFHEITKDAIAAAVDKPRTIDLHLVDAQQARRVLDRLVGYEISPILWRKVRPGLSAGRVQSVAVRLIVERERQINDFSAVHSFKLTAVLTAADQSFSAEWSQPLKDQAAAEAALERLSKAELKVAKVADSDTSRSPAPPFTTSTLQQEAARRLGFSVKQTMRLAQGLYEAGAITYMRTDSVNISGQALARAGDFIKDRYGADYHQFRRFATKTKGAQEAHEAIRPTEPAHDHAGGDDRAKKLYQLIRGRFLASQMATAKLKKTTITIEAGQDELKAEGEVLVFEGWLAAYPKAKPKDSRLPKLAAGDKLKLESAQAVETPSKPPARYTEASLVKKLEEMGIGRPSTYAPTVSTIQARGYVEKGPGPARSLELTTLTLSGGEVTAKREVQEVGGEGKKLLPTDTAMVVTDFLTKTFKDIVDYDFTSEVEAEFDRIAEGKQAWDRMIKDFYADFKGEVGKAAKVSRSEVSQARLLGHDPKTKQPIYARYGRYGPMLQRGDADNEDDKKPDFAPMPADAALDSVTLEQALPMFVLPRVLAVEDGEEIRANIGRFGPYVQRGKLFVSIPKDMDVFTISLEEAMKLIEAKAEARKKAVIQHFDSGIEVRLGRFGHYVTDGKVNAKLGKADPKTITEAEAQALLKAKLAGKARK